MSTHFREHKARAEAPLGTAPISSRQRTARAAAGASLNRSAWNPLGREAHGQRRASTPKTGKHRDPFRITLPPGLSRSGKWWYGCWVTSPLASKGAGCKAPIQTTNSGVAERLMIIDHGIEIIQASNHSNCKTPGTFAPHTLCRYFAAMGKNVACQETLNLHRDWFQGDQFLLKGTDSCAGSMFVFGII